MDEEITKAVQYAQRLLDAAINLVGDAKVDGIDKQWGRHPHVVALTILCRSICNFRASLRLAQDQQVVEARVLVRLMYENVLWLNMVKLRGSEFVEEMRQDEAANRKALAQLTMEVAGRQGGGEGLGALQLRSILRGLRTDHPEAKQLQAKVVASDGELDMVYVEYRRFSLDAVHCSVTALGRHLSREHTEGRSELVLSVIPNTPPKEVFDTIMHANHALLCAAVGANELVRCESSNTALSSLWAELDASEWRK